MLVNSGQFLLMTASRNLQFPSHCFYTDDVFVFGKGTKRNLRILMKLFNGYAAASGQQLSLGKFKFYVGSMSNNRKS